MNKQPIVTSGERNISPFLAACACIHLAGDFLLMRKAWFLEFNELLIAMALPLSQCSLIAIWAASSRAMLVLRFAVPALVAVFCWYVLSQILPWGIGEPASAAWAIVIMVQIIAVVVAIRLYRLFVAVIARRTPESNTAGRSQLSFDLATLMLWSTVIACGFGFMQFGRDKLNWGANIANWECLHAMPVIAIFNAMLAVLWLWSLTFGDWQVRAAKVAIAVVLVVCSFSVMSRLISWIANGNCDFDAQESRIFLTSQSIFLIASLAIIVAGISITKPDADAGQ